MSDTNVKPMGLNKKPTFNELIHYLNFGQEIISLPNRYFRQIRDSPWLSQIDGEDSSQIEAQQQRQAKIQQRDAIIVEVARDGDTGAQEARVVNHITNNTFRNTFASSYTPPQSSDFWSQTDANNGVNRGTSTDTHRGVNRGTSTETQQKFDTGTGSDYTPPPDPFTPAPPSAPIHYSTSRATQGVHSKVSQAVTGGTASGSASHVNPILEKHNQDKREGPQVFDMAVDENIDENAMNLQQQAAVNRAYQAEAKQEKRERSRGALRASLKDDVGPEIAKRAGEAARNRVMSAHLDRQYQIALQKSIVQQEWLEKRAQAQISIDEHANQMRAQMEAEYRLAHESLDQHKKAHARASAEKDTIMKNKEKDIDQQKRTLNLESLNLEMAQKKTRKAKERVNPVVTPQVAPPQAPAEAPIRGRSRSTKPKQIKIGDGIRSWSLATVNNDGKEHAIPIEKRTTSAERIGTKQRKAISQPPLGKKSKLISSIATEALDAELTKANKIIIGKTAKQIKTKKALDTGILKASSMTKAKASVEPQPDSDVTVIKRGRGRPTGSTKTPSKSLQAPKQRGRPKGKAKA